MAPLMPVLEPTCPWVELIRRYPPNVKWCEAPLCAWIREPANSWSNLAYVLVGLWLLRRARREGRLTGVFGMAALVLGLCSFVYHASTNFVLQVLDFAGMYLYGCLPLLLNLQRLGWLSPRRLIPGCLLSAAGLTGVTPLVHLAGLPIQGIVVVLVAGVLTTEVRLMRRAPRASGVALQPVPRRWFLLSLGLLAVAAVASALDVTRLACDPQNHWLQGHALWHVLTALGLAALSRHYVEAMPPCPSRVASR